MSTSANLRKQKAIIDSKKIDVRIYVVENISPLIVLINSTMGNGIRVKILCCIRRAC